MVSGVATLPTNYDDNHLAFAKFDNGSITEDLSAVDPDDEDEYEDGERAVWIEAIGDGDRYMLRTKTVMSQRYARYQKKALTLQPASMVLLTLISELSLSVHDVTWS